MAGRAKTPGRAPAAGWRGGNWGDDAAAGATGGKADATVDIGALMRKSRAQLLVPSGGGVPAAGARRQLPPGSRLDAIAAADNPIYSPDDSLAKAASKLAGLKALRSSVAPPPRGGLPQAARADAAPHPQPQPCESPQLIPAEGSQGRLSGEDSGELAARAALQTRRKSVAPTSAAKQRYGEWFDGSDTDLEHTLHEYNRAGAGDSKASPRMTRAQRRKSLAVDRSMALEPGLAKSLLAGEREEQWQEEQVAAPEQQQEAQAAKRGSSGRRKSQAASRQVPVEAGQAPAEAKQPESDSVADEVAALNAQMCAALTGLVGEESPEKGPRGGPSLRDKLLASWDGRSYYERLLEISSQGEEAQAPTVKQQRQAAAKARTPSAKAPFAGSKPGAAAGAGPAPAFTASASALTQAAKASAGGKPAPTPLEVGGGAMAAAKAVPSLPTPNSQRRKLNELTQSLHLLKVSSRHQRTQAALRTAESAPPAGSGTTGKPAQRGSLPPLLDAATQQTAANHTPRSRSASPEVDPPATSTQASAGATAAPKAGSNCGGGRRGATPPTEASTAAAAAGSRDTELAAAYQMLDAALADKDVLAGQLHAVRAALTVEHAAREQERAELEQAKAQLEAARQEQKEEASTARVAEQKAKQLAAELQEAQQAAASAAAAVADVEARCAEAEKALGAVLKAANSGAKALAAGREEAKGAAEALRGAAGGVENTPAAPTASSRSGRQSSGRLWR